MAPYLFGQKAEVKGDKTTYCKHIVCEICGKDFAQWTSREKHRRQAHQASQEIHCKGEGPIFDAAVGEMVHGHCNAIFKSASELVYHFESGQCQYITRPDIHTERNQKHVVKQIMEEPDTFAKIIDESKAADEGKAYRSDSSGKSRSVSPPGGVGLEAFPPLVPVVAGAKQSVFLKESHEELEDLAQQVQRFSEMALTGRPWGAADVTKALPSSATNTGTAPAGTTTSTGPMVAQAAPQASTRSTYSDGEEWPANPSKVWPSLSTMANNSAIQKSAAYSSLTTDQTNLFHSRFWDPSHVDYNPDLFFNTTEENFICPFPGCGDGYSTRHQWETHMRSFHANRAARIECPQCGKRFKNVTALVQHFEASMRNAGTKLGEGCLVARRSDFKRIMDEVTGGFVSVTKSAEEVMVGYKSDGKKIVKVDDTKEVGYWGEKEPGVQTMKFEGSKPTSVVKW